MVMHSRGVQGDEKKGEQAVGLAQEIGCFQGHLPCGWRPGAGEPTRQNPRFLRGRWSCLPLPIEPASLQLCLLGHSPRMVTGVAELLLCSQLCFSLLQGRAQDRSPPRASLVGCLDIYLISHNPSLLFAKIFRVHDIYQ